MNDRVATGETLGISLWWGHSAQRGTHSSPPG